MKLINQNSLLKNVGSNLNRLTQTSFPGGVLKQLSETFNEGLTWNIK